MNNKWVRKKGTAHGSVQSELLCKTAKTKLE